MPTLVEVTCLCGDCQETITIQSEPPFDSITCSCDICRYCTGVLFLTCLPLQSRPQIVDRLKQYESSSHLTRYFCGQCGTHLFCMQHNDQSWQLCAGAVDGLLIPGPESLSQLQAFRQHEFVGSTLDGGLSVCLAEFQGKNIPMFMQGPSGELFDKRSPERISFAAVKPPQDPPAERYLRQSRAQADTLRLACHCESVELIITQPSEVSKQCLAPWPDLIVPHSAHSANPDDVKWWLCDSDTRYLAGTCACRSCRLGTGSPIQTWAFIPNANILKLDGSPFDHKLGSLQQYQSSARTFREFCGSCGATVCWWSEERPDLIDISVGLLQAPEGARAQRWLRWCTNRVSFKEEAGLHKVLAEELEKGLHLLEKQ